MVLRLSSSLLNLVLPPRRIVNFSSKLISRFLTTCVYDLTGDGVLDHGLLYDNENIAGTGKDSAKSRLFEKGFNSQFQNFGFLSNAYLVNRCISGAIKSGLFDVGIQLHSAVIKMGFVSNVYICSALVDMYCKCGEMLKAHNLFDEMTLRNVVTWNSLISGYLKLNCPGTGLQLFVDMLKEGITPSAYTISAALVGCSQLKAEDSGTQIHGLILKTGYVSNVVLGTCMVDMYSKCSNVKYSRKFFDQMQHKNAITWTALVGGYAQNGDSCEAMILAGRMLRLGLHLNYVTYNSLLSSFSSCSDLNHCKQIQCRVVKDGYDSNTYIIVTLVTLYSRCSNSLDDFNKVLLGIRTWDQIAWNAVVAGYANLGNGDVALKCFSAMRRAQIAVDRIAFTSVLGTAGAASALEEGKQIHGLVLKIGYSSNLYVQNGLVSMYAKCGAILDSKRAFLLIDKHDVVSWNSLLSGCAHHGYGEEAIDLFEQMRRTNVKPNSTTFLAMLSACSHGRFLDKGLEYFDMMRNDSCFEPPKMEHYAAVVDLFSRAGCLAEAEAFIINMPLEPGPSVYKALLSACLVHEDKDIALRTAKKLLDLWPDDTATYVLLVKMLLFEGYWKEAAEVRQLMCDKGLRMKTACSWI